MSLFSLQSSTHSTQGSLSMRYCLKILTKGVVVASIKQLEPVV